VRLCICDYSGHPFQVQLSRELARRGHDVIHLHFAEFQTPKGRLTVGPDDPSTLAIEAVSLGRPFAKYGFVKRRFQEVEIGRRIAERISAYAPDAVIGSNLPIDALDVVVSTCAKAHRPFVFWQQDIYSTAIGKILGEKYGAAGRIVGSYYRFLERRAAAKSAAIVVIAADFIETLDKEFRIPSKKIHVIENWAPLDEIVPRPKVNRWSTANGFADSDIVLYTGTLGMKHDPGKLLAVAEGLRSRPKTCVVVASEGPSATWLSEQAAARALPTLKVIPFQPFEVYSEVLATADVLISALEADAGTFSVPSKILSYLCAGRSIVLSAPADNLASSIIQRSNAGLVVPPTDTPAFVDAVGTLLADASMRSQCAANARRHAESTFDISRIGSQFETVFSSVVRSTGGLARPGTWSEPEKATAQVAS
jgi:glycosyltransferase involved in cell wall biosynthesis